MQRLPSNIRILPIYILLVYFAKICSSTLFDYIVPNGTGIKIHKAYVQQLHRCFFIESTIIDDFFDQVSIVRGIFFPFLYNTEQQTKVKRKKV